MKLFEKRIFKRITYNYDLDETEEEIFLGGLIQQDSNQIKYAFTNDNLVYYMTFIKTNDDFKVSIVSKESSSEVHFCLDKETYYTIKLTNGYVLRFICQTNFIKKDENKLNISYNLYDEIKKQIISKNEIIITGERTC